MKKGHLQIYGHLLAVNRHIAVTQQQVYRRWGSYEFVWRDAHLLSIHIIHPLGVICVCILFGPLWRWLYRHRSDRHGSHRTDANGRPSSTNTQWIAHSTSTGGRGQIRHRGTVFTCINFT